MPTTIQNTLFDLLPAPSFGAFRTIRMAPKVTFQAAAGYKHQRERYANARYKFDHGWNVLTTAQYNILMAWLDYAKSNAFYYVVPDTEFFTGITLETHLVHIIEDEIEILPIGKNQYRVKLVMEDL